jgi:hypothetical protein
VKTITDIANGGDSQQYFLHNPDGNADGLSTAQMGAEAVTPTTPSSPTSYESATAANPSPGSVPPMLRVCRVIPRRSPSLWRRGITKAIKGAARPFSASLPPEFVPLLQAAEDVWQGLANVKFATVADDATNRV